MPNHHSTKRHAQQASTSDPSEADMYGLGSGTRGALQAMDWRPSPLRLEAIAII